MSRVPAQEPDGEGGTGASASLWSDLVRPLVAGRPVILTGSPVAAYTSTVKWLRRLGSERVLVIGTAIGSGPKPAGADADCVVMEGGHRDQVAEFRRVQELLGDPPRHIRDAVERHDPEHTARLFIAPFQIARELAGRPATGSRRSDWVRLEDKTLADELFDAAGVARPPSIVATATSEDLVAAADQLDVGKGTVWAGDSSRGFNGAGAYVRWIKRADAAAVARAVSFFATRCDRVRVAPLLEGLPCSIHGVVVDDGVAVLRPMEMVVPHDGHGRFRYAGIATFWDPPPRDREAMRDVARRVGQLLARRVGFRGSFGVDGIMTPTGFLPTEINPRFGSGMGALGRRLSDYLPLSLVHHALVDRPAAISAVVLENELRFLADRHRFGGGWLATERAHGEALDVPIHLQNERWEMAVHDSADATLSLGAGSSGGFVRVELDPRRTSSGVSVSERIVAALRFADRLYEMGIGPLVSPRPVVQASGRKTAGGDLNNPSPPPTESAASTQ